MWDMEGKRGGLTMADFPHMEQKQKQTQKLLMSPQMKQAVHVLQVPIMEISQVIEQELEMNPVLEYAEEIGDEVHEGEDSSEEREREQEQELAFDERDFEMLRQIDDEFRDMYADAGSVELRQTQEDQKKQTYLESSIQFESTLFEHLMQQAREVYDTERELLIAELIIGSLDDSGFLETSLEELADSNGYDVSELKQVLQAIQCFDPVGVGAKNVQESLMIQLRAMALENTLAYEIVNCHFDDLLHNRIPKIRRGLKCSTEEIQEAVERHIARLDLHPGSTHAPQVAQQIVPDVYLHQEGDELVTSVDREITRPLRLNRRYMKMYDDPNASKEVKEFIRTKVLSAKWLMRTLEQRHSTIERLVQSLAHHHREYFMEADGKLVPMTMSQIAEELELHESTVARCVQNKYLQCPRGLLPLRYFFSTGYQTASGEEISSKTVQNVLQDIVQNEDKESPLSDEKISKMMEKKGIKCARRTIAKLRKLLKIGNTRQRRKY